MKCALFNLIFTLFVVLVVFVVLIDSHIWFHEDFNDDGWEQRWKVSDLGGKDKATEIGRWNHTTGLYYGSILDKGIQTIDMKRYYGISSKLNQSFTSAGDFIIQMSVKQEKDMFCGGMYLKVYGDDVNFDQDHFNSDTPFQVMFGPDICGEDNKQTHAIFYYEKKEQYFSHLKPLQMKHDRLSHLYTLWIREDQTYEFFVDMNVKASGTLEEGWGFRPPEYIPDPQASKPFDWVDEKTIEDITDVKPVGWDDIPEEIPDPDAVQPTTWNTRENGDWEPPLVPNPQFRGEWTPRLIKNPDYIGEWEHPMILNPRFTKKDNELHVRCKGCAYVGFELWQVSSMTLFDDIMITDSFDDITRTWKVFEKKSRLEGKMYEKKIQRDKARVQELTNEAMTKKKLDSTESELGEEISDPINYGEDVLFEVPNELFEDEKEL